MIWPQDVIERYHTEVFKRDMAGSVASAISGERKIDLVPTERHTVVAEVEVPAAFVGKTIRQLDIRQTFGVSVLMIKQTTAPGEEHINTAPTPDYVFRPGDILLVLGPDDELRHLRRGVPPVGT